MKESNCILIAELGATNARIALTMEGTTLIESKEYLLADFSSVDHLFEAYFEEIKQKATRGIIGVAAPVLGEKIRFTNNNIMFNQRALKDKIFSKGLKVINDLELQAYALEDLGDEEVLRIGEVEEEKKGSKVLISPGSGLGLAGIVDKQIIFTEGGHLNIPSDSQDIKEILKKFKQDRGRNPTFEDLMSGKGINYIYKCFNNSVNSGYTNEEILVNKVDSACLKTRKLMLYLLATYAKYIALIWGATSGVYFSGSIANSLLQPEELETFRADFENSPTMQELLVTIPVFLIKDLNLGLRGGLVLALRG